MKTDNKQKALPYVSYPTFKAFICYLHDTVVTDIIDNSMMPNSFSGSAKGAVTSALKSLGLIDNENKTTQNLKNLAKTYNTKEWPEAVKNCILSAYNNISGNIDLKSASRKQLEGMFGDITSQMRDKYIRFFLSAHKDAGIEYSPHLKIRRRLPKKRVDTATPKGGASGQRRTKPPEVPPTNDKTPSDMFDLPMPIAAGSFIRVPRNITANQVPLVKAAIAFIEEMAKQNEASE